MRGRMCVGPQTPDGAVSKPALTWYATTDPRYNTVFRTNSFQPCQNWPHYATPTERQQDLCRVNKLHLVPDR